MNSARRATELALILIKSGAGQPGRHVPRSGAGRAGAAAAAAGAADHRDSPRGDSRTSELSRARHEQAREGRTVRGSWRAPIRGWPAECPCPPLSVTVTAGQPAPVKGVWRISAGGRCKGCGRAQARGWPLNCDVLPLNIKGASRFLRKWPPAPFDIEPPEVLWPETKGQAASLARVRGHPLHGAEISQRRRASCN